MYIYIESLTINGGIVITIFIVVLWWCKGK